MAPEPGSGLGGVGAPASAGPERRLAGSGGRLTPEAFAEMFQAHHRALWCIGVAITRDSNTAHDVVQEAAVVALAKLGEFDPATSFAAWCGQIVRFVALNERRRGVRSPARATDPGVMAANAPVAVGTGGPLDASFSGPLRAALEELDETARACLLMKAVMDMSYRQIAEALGIPEGTAMSHVHRSRQVMRAKLERLDGGAKGVGR